MSFFEAAYEGTPPWDIGRPQNEFVRLAEEGEIAGKILDAGCGTGEHALYLASRGLQVWGIDEAPSAIRKAQEKAEEREIAATFLFHDALDLQGLGMQFDTVIDSGLFHVFSDEDRPTYERGLYSALVQGGTYIMLCFSEREPGDWGPRRVSREEIRGIFSARWGIEYIREAEFETMFGPHNASAWLSRLTRLG